ncbi:hypothetical protein [Pantoea allii]|uniref:hypothetical protein n=1 Tax=Pantoea allii TaxID=574096 RepID=UPI001F4D3A43|nr:hypothetical protein [Pantoea allii]MCH9299907.1 hypothetical protein [Pantoea allii]
MGKRKTGARIGNPVARAAAEAAEAAERKRKANTQIMAASNSNRELVENDPLNDENLDESEDLMDAFMVEYPQWSVEVNPDQPWVVTSQIIRAFDSFVMWRNQAAEDGKALDLEQCFEVNKVTDVASDVREFLIKHDHIQAE